MGIFVFRERRSALGVGPPAPSFARKPHIQITTPFCRPASKPTSSRRSASAPRTRTLTANFGSQLQPPSLRTSNFPFPRRTDTGHGLRAHAHVHTRAADLLRPPSQARTPAARQTTPCSELIQGSLDHVTLCTTKLQQLSPRPHVGGSVRDRTWSNTPRRHALEPWGPTCKRFVTPARPPPRKRPDAPLLLSIRAQTGSTRGAACDLPLFAAIRGTRFPTGDHCMSCGW